MSEEKFLRLAELQEKTGDKQGQLETLRALKSFREKSVSVAPSAALIGMGAGGMHSLQPTSALAQDLSGQEASTAAELAKGVPGLAPAAVSGAVLEPIAGVAGIAQAVNPFADPGAGARAVESVRSLSIPPIGEAARKTAGALSEALTPAGEAIDAPAEAVFEATGSPLAAAATQTVVQGIPELIGSRFGVKGVKGGADSLSNLRKVRMKEKTQKRLIDDETGLPTKELQKALDKRGLDIGAISEGELPRAFGNKSANQIVDDIIKHKLKAGEGSSALHKLKLSKGKIVPDELGIQAKRQGFREGDISSLKGANASTKIGLRRMLEMKRQIEADSSKALKFRPSDVIGSHALKRFDFVKDEASKLRKELDDLAKSDADLGVNLLEGPGVGAGLKDLEIDTSKVANDYRSGLAELKIGFSGEPPKLDFKNSLISEDPTSQRVIKSITRILSKGDAVTASEAHLVKRQIDTMLDFTKKSPSGLTDAGKKFAKSIRKSVNDSIRDVSPRYAEINDRLSTAITALEDFDGALKSIDPEGLRADQSVGQTLRRLLSNAQSRVELSNSLSQIDKVANDFGAGFTDDIDRMIIFNNMLDDRFGATAKGGIQGTIESAIKTGAIAKGREIVGEKIAEKIASDKKAFDVLHKILRRGN